MAHQQELGSAGEAVVAAWYERRGYEILERNWRCREGEIDVIARLDDVVVICEVKTRSTDRFGSGLDAVDGRKQRRLRALGAGALAATGFDPAGTGLGAAATASLAGGLAGAAYLSSGAQPGWRPVRFDVASVTPGPHGYSVQVVEAAF